jgi:carboxyl-terminal processing protease
MARRSLAVVLGLVVALSGACAAPGDRAESPDRPIAESGATEVFRDSYRYIRDRYVRTVVVRDVAIAGLKGLSLVDAELSVASSAVAVTVLHGGRKVTTLPAPGPQDHERWGELTAAAVKAAAASSAELRKAGAERVQQAVIASALNSLDPFSRYVPPSDARENRNLRNGYGGIGITVQMVQSELKVIAVMPGTPAEAAGLRADDTIASIGGKPTAGQELRDIVQQLRGPEGSRVVLTVVRSPSTQPMEIAVFRRHILPVAAVYRRDGNVAHIQVSRFIHGTARQLTQAVVQAKREIGPKIAGIILDLRDDPGGLLDQGIAVADLFLPHGRIVSTVGRHRESQQSYEARPGDIASGIPIVVLINGRTASSSEIVASALQDNGRAIVVGSTSYGKGTVQTVFTLPNDGELVLTWSRFHAPSGYALESLGVFPNLCTAKKGTNAKAVLKGVSSNDQKIAGVFRQWRTIVLPNPARAKVLRSNCESDVNDAARNALDMEVARGILSEPALYQRALATSQPAQSAFRSPGQRDFADPDEQ